MKINLGSSHTWKKAFIWFTVILLATLFTYAAYNKLIIYDTFVKQLKESPATTGYENLLGWLVPSIEILIAILILLPKTREVGLYGAFFLMLMFTIYVYVIPHFFKQQTCSCGGIINNFSWEDHFYFNLFFTLLAGAGLIVKSYRYPKKLNVK